MLVARGRPQNLAKARLLLDEALAIARRLGMTRVAERAEVLGEQISRASSTAAHPGREPSFRLNGDYWTIVFDGRVVLLRDGEGVRYLAQLLASPGQWFHVLELVARAHSRRSDAATQDPASTEAVLAEAGLRLGRLGGTGAVLDEQAKTTYQRRLVELEAELDEARAANDAGRLEGLRSEMDSLVGELNAALGLKGRSRRATDAAERARTSVAKALRRTLARIEASHPSLGRHLSATLRTGMLCIYSLDPLVRMSWSIFTGSDGT
jgi:hypothetical protein